MKTEHNDNLEEIEWGGVLNEFLWTCAGANKKSSDNVRQTMLNMLVLEEQYCLLH